MRTGVKLKPLIVFELLVGLAASILFLLAMSLNFANPGGGGESRIANAYESLAALGWLWMALFVLLVVDAARLPRHWPASATAMVLLPVAAVATLFATDYPHDLVCIFSFPAMPMLFGALALLPRGRPAVGRTSVLVAIAALSAFLIIKFLS